MDELRTALELATDEELQDLTEILFRPRFNPLDYLRKTDPLDIQSRDRDGWLDALEDRFRYLAADGLTVISQKTSQLSYRQILIQVCRHMRLPYKMSMSTVDLEAEVFLGLLGRAWKQLPVTEKGEFTIQLKHSLTKSQLLPQLPLTAQQDPMSLVVKGSTAIAVTSVLRPMLMQLIAKQFAVYVARYQVAQAAALSGAIAAQLQNVALQTARQGMALSATRYATMRGVFACLGPALWMYFFADLGWRSVSTNYGRVIPTIYALAQIRLTRTECFELA
ncbi:hypothetical protein JOY44_01490 [Phormidium sp. CLA17]|uniref:YaaW family protein n=1 Tax=Leptolyngbya sp. Cla-17 TaxID=2803751 RepID=UPI00149271AC|nr:hypothetical protein [Leptolyngbya sp. Cla-17]MBM0740302.1 hypothetical protein [Leptolyngbya sp. Cla-17]